MHRNVLLLPLLLMLSSCLSPTATPTTRYFAPPESAPTAATQPAERPLRLGAFSQSGGVEPRMMFRLSEVEFAFDDINRWLEQPRKFLERALRDELFGSGAFQLAPATAKAAQLTVHIEHLFMDQVDASQPASTVTLRVTLQLPAGDELRASFTGRARAAGGIAGHVQAMAAAIASATGKVRAWLLASQW